MPSISLQRDVYIFQGGYYDETEELDRDGNIRYMLARNQQHQTTTLLVDSVCAPGKVYEFGAPGDPLLNWWHFRLAGGGDDQAGFDRVYGWLQTVAARGITDLECYLREVLDLQRKAVRAWETFGLI